MQNDLVHFPPNCFGTGEDIRIECLLLGQNHLSSLPSSFLSLTRLQVFLFLYFFYFIYFDYF